MKTPDAILCSDLHLREDTPVCRTDDYWEAQWKKVRWLKRLQLKHDCPVICAGDIFNHWKPSPYLIRMAIEFLPNNMMVVAGQHDLPQHNLDLVNKSGLGVLIESEKVDLLGKIYGSPFEYYGFSWGEELSESPGNKNNLPMVAVVHHLTYISKPWPDAPPEGNAASVCERLRGFGLIVTGDNHQSFEYRSRSGQLLVNPGSMMRMTADQEGHKPRVFLWYAEENEVKPVHFPMEEGAVTRGHIDKQEGRDGRMEAYISRMNTEYEVGLSFKKNLERHLEKNKTEQPIKDMIWKAHDNDKN